ncbi:nicotinamide riboside kinase [Podospora conica]|nr:nicotinamide riboside kinase [Schizothecium conicum]
MEDRKAIIIGISGCSSSGKTTLARLLRDIFPNTFILHEDDFYKSDDQIPIKDGIADWDCAEALSLPDMEAALAHIRTAGTFPVSTLRSPSLSHRRDHGRPPPPTVDDDSLPSPPPPHPLTSPRPQPTVNSKEDLNSVGALPISDAQVAASKARVAAWLAPGQPGSRIFSSPSAPRICLLDGFLLYSPPAFSTVMASLDVKLFLLVSREKATHRREARDGYVTLDGFWQDPPGYVEKIVWPNYAAAHAWMFEGGDAEKGVLDQRALEREGIHAQVGKGMDVEFGETLGWAVETIMGELERLVLGR